ncbi:MAG TPA: DUF3243 family protein [Bacillota bacterium]|jgi:hypothetical protein
MSEQQFFPKKLASTIKDGIEHGVSDDQIVKGMISLGNLAENFVSPDSPQESMAKAMWEEAKPDEKETMARIVLRVAKKKMH